MVRRSWYWVRLIVSQADQSPARDPASGNRTTTSAGTVTQGSRKPPLGVVTFLFTDIEGSTQLWQLFPDAMSVALTRHHTIMRQAIESHDGYVFQIVGDELCAAFSNAVDGISASIAAQRALHDEPWGETGQIRVRMALQTGTAELHTGDYTAGEYASGLTLSRAARLMSAGHGGQIILSAPTHELTRDQLPENVTLRDMGERRLKDLIRPEHIYQIVAPDLPQEFPPLKSLDSRPNNLPVQVTNFIGREREMREIKSLLASTHLLTLLGIGGAGKSRLSIQVAADLIDDFDHGVWFVELAPLTNPALVPQAVAAALGVREETQRPLIDTLCEYLRQRHVLLILDNCEHLIDACARLADTLLRVAPDLKFLTSSREALRIVGEVTYRVPPLTNPDPHNLPPIATLSQFEAVRLFVDRAVAVSPGFTLNETNASSVAQICHRLDGIPLAIELAAARTKALSANQIAARLDDRFRLLTTGSRAALPRQQTLRALIDWSYDLLTESERVLWQRLSVFAGGWTLEMAEKICAGDPIESFAVLDLLTNLVDKSIVLADQNAQSPRYSMLETLRQYGLDKLREEHADANARKSHADFFLKLAEEAEPHFQAPDQKEWLVRLAIEFDNFRAALAYYLDAEPVTALKLAATMGFLWQVHGNFIEGRSTLERVLQAANQSPKDALAKAFLWQGILASRQGDYENAKEPLLKSLTLFRELGNKRGTAGALNVLGVLAWSQGENSKAEKLYQESLALFHELGEDRRVARVLSNLGNLTLAQGDYEASRRYNEEGVAVSRKLGDKLSVALSLNNLGVIKETQGDLIGAQRSYEESIAISNELGEKMSFGYSLNGLAHVMFLQNDFATSQKYYRESLMAMQAIGDKRGIAYCLEGFAKVAIGNGNTEQAAQLMANAEQLRQAIGSPLNQSERTEYDKGLVRVRTQLGEQNFESAWAKGQAMTMEQAIECALEENPHKIAPSH